MSFIPPNKIYTYFNSNFTIKKSTQGWYAFKCPLCNELHNRRKIAVHFQYAVVKCWICGYQESVIDFVSEMEGVDYNAARKILKNSKDAVIDLNYEEEDKSGHVLSEVRMPFGFTPLLEGSGSLGNRARDYLTNRGFNIKELDRMGMGYCNSSPPEGSEEKDYFGYIIVPFKSRGKLVYYIGRDFIGNFLRYDNPDKATFGVGKGDLFFNEDALWLYEEVFVLEGWSDAYTIGRDAVASLGWKLSKTQKNKLLKSEAEIINLVPDAGYDGQGVLFYLRALELAIDLMPHKQVRVVNLNNLPDGKDVNEIGKEKFMELYKKSPVLDAKDAMLEFLTYEN